MADPLVGHVAPLGREALIALMDDLSAEHEEKLAPKTPWTRAKMDPALFEGLLKAITGFEIEVAEWRGTAKLDQDKPDAVRGRLADAIAEAGWREAAELVRTPSKATDAKPIGAPMPLQPPVPLP